MSEQWTTAVTRDREPGHHRRPSLLTVVMLIAGLLALASPTSADVAPTDPTSAAASASRIARGGSTDVTLSATGTTTSAVTPTDVMLVLDESGSISSADFMVMKTFARDLVADLADAGLFSNGGRVGLAMFADRARLVLALPGGTTEEAVTRAVGTTTQYGGYTCLTCAVEVATAHLSAAEPGRNRIMIMLTDGAGNERVSELPAKVNAAQAAGIERFVVGVGAAVSIPEINLIASDPDADHVFTRASFGELTEIVSALVGAVDRPAATAATVSATAAAPFSISSPLPSRGTATVTGNVLTWDIGSLGAETVTLTYTLTHDGSLSCGAALPVHSSVTYGDAEGATGVTFPMVSLDVTGCPAAVGLSPAIATPTVGTTHSLRAAVTDDFGDPVSGSAVTFTVTSGPNAGASQTATTDAGGVASATYTSTMVGTDTVTATAGDTSASAVMHWQPSWPWSGFMSPIGDAPTVNPVKAGSSVPVKFSLGGDRGLSIFMNGSPSSRPTTCDGGAPAQEVEAAVTAGASGLTYDATSDTYTYVWRTDQRWTGCRTLTLSFANGMTHTALFSMK